MKKKLLLVIIAFTSFVSEILPGEDQSPKRLSYSLIKATSEQDPNIKKITNILKSGADINARNHVGYTPLMLALKPNVDIAIIKLLLNHGADTNAKNNHGMTPLMRAIRPNIDTAIIKLLLKYGAHVTPKDTEIALRRNRPDIAELLSYYIKAY